MNNRSAANRRVAKRGWTEAFQEQLFCWHEFHAGLKEANAFIEYSNNLIDSLYEGHIVEKRRIQINEISRHIIGISFYDSIVVFEKRLRPGPFHIRKGTETIEPYSPTGLKKTPLLKKFRERLLGKKDTWKSNDRGKL